MNQVRCLVQGGVRFATALGVLLAAAPAFAAVSLPVVQGFHRLVSYAGCAIGIALAVTNPLLATALLGCISLVLEEI